LHPTIAKSTVLLFLRTGKLLDHAICHRTKSLLVGGGAAWKNWQKNLAQGKYDPSGS
jgi:hypothetical protein